MNPPKSTTESKGHTHLILKIAVNTATEDTALILTTQRDIRKMTGTEATSKVDAEKARLTASSDIAETATGIATTNLERSLLTRRKLICADRKRKQSIKPNEQSGRQKDLKSR